MKWTLTKFHQFLWKSTEIDGTSWISMDIDARCTLFLCYSLGWTRRMHWEHKCKFVSMVWVLASAEVVFVVWIGPKFLRQIEGFALFHLHFLLLLPGGGGF